MQHFGDALIGRVRALGNPVCIGLDPYLDRIPPLFRDGDMSPGNPLTAPAVEAFLKAVLDRADGRVAVVKPQIAFFERMGWRGLRALDEVSAHARKRGMLVLLDAKRGDIGSTADAYAGAYLTADAPMPADAMTLNPYLGRDTLQPYLNAAKDTGRGLFILVKTSNPGSGDYQDLKVGNRSLAETVADSLKAMSGELEGPETGWSSLGIVVGATYPGEAERIREILPKTIFLVPGYGAQGATAADAVKGFVKGPSGLEGGIVSSSRGVLYPAGSDTDSAAAWEQAMDAAIDMAVSELGGAISA
ncbi:orotidine-5'-phosphate decarboxylase [Nisaea acidiphila]|uniref:Orotidine 5'-phosphate decarboxylase n=1 Tax=Nisaea acidiphila TaxID=1862145 RepID=A0A9J7APB8_9PROT|nr:orotidine-5'-phosphate decarboxylase [Nisaea acidiphila]UUX48441.1 orotidine-5'-phosphate decarboxylase [Nisaea acidiphila]